MHINMLHLLKHAVPNKWQTCRFLSVNGSQMQAFLGAFVLMTNKDLEWKHAISV